MDSHDPYASDPYYEARVVLPDNSRKPVDQAAQPNLHAMKIFVNRKMRITLTDGRVLTGTCICFDYLGNILMNYTEESHTRVLPGGTYTDSRNLGMIMVKAHHRVKVEGEWREEDPPLAQMLLR